MKILNFGSCNIDYVYSLSHIVKEGETINCNNLQLFAGGKGLNQSVAVKKAGANVYHAGITGVGGEFLRDTLTQSGVDIKYLKEENTVNGHAIIQVNKNGQNSIVIYDGSNGAITKEYITEVLDNFSEGDILILQNEISEVPFLIEEAAKRGLITVFNPSPVNETISKIDFNKVQYLLVNKIEAENISKHSDCNKFIEFMREKYPQLNVVLTLGANGCVFFNKIEEIHQNAYKVNAVDTTAAGDTFTGYFVAGIYNNDNIQKILRYSCAAAAISVTRKGASPSVPTIEEVESFLKEKK